MEDSPPQKATRLQEPFSRGQDRNWQLKNSPFAALATLGQTLEDWQEEIARMWRFRRTNGITEGSHIKMEMISRRAFGFKNFDNYRLRVRACCC